MFAKRCDQLTLRIRATGAVSAFVANFNVRAGCGDKRRFVKCRKAAERERAFSFMLDLGLRRIDLFWQGSYAKIGFIASALFKCRLLVAQIFAAYRERAAGPFGVKAACAALVRIILQGIRLFDNTLDRSPNEIGNIFNKLQCARWTNAHTGAAARTKMIVDRKQTIIVARDRLVRTNLKARRAARVAMAHAHAGRLIDFDRLLPQFRKRFCSIEERGHVHFQVVQVSLLLACQAKLCDMMLVIVEQTQAVPHFSEVKHFILKIE